MIFVHVSGMRQSCQSQFFWLWAPNWRGKNLLQWQGHLESHTVLFFQGWEASRKESVHTWDVPSIASVLLDKVFHSSPKTICSACCPDLKQGEGMGCTISVVTERWIEGRQSSVWGDCPPGLKALKMWTLWIFCYAKCFYPGATWEMEEIQNSIRAWVLT